MYHFLFPLSRGVGHFCIFYSKKPLRNWSGSFFVVYPLGFFSRKAVLCVRSRSLPTYRHSLISPLKSVTNAFLHGQLVPTSTANAFSKWFETQVHQKNAPLAEAFWCTRWGSNPNSTASEAVMLSNYTTSTFFLFKRYQYFTIFCFLFASIYDILFLNYSNFLAFKGVCYVENSRDRYEWRGG